MSESDFSQYLTHSAEDEQWQMVCTDAGRQRIAPGSPYPPDKQKHPEDKHHQWCERISPRAEWTLGLRLGAPQPEQCDNQQYIDHHKEELRDA